MGEVDWEKRARELSVENSAEHWDAMLQLGREMADARAEEIAKAIEDGKPECAKRGDWVASIHWVAGREFALAIARSFIQKPKTREAVLEEALRRARDCRSWTELEQHVRRALEWRPET